MTDRCVSFLCQFCDGTQRGMSHDDHERMLAYAQHLIRHHWTAVVDYRLGSPEHLTDPDADHRLNT